MRKDYSVAASEIAKRERKAKMGLSKGVGCIGPIVWSAIIAIPNAYAFGLLLKQYWIWFFIPIAKNSFGVGLPSLTWTTCAVIMFALDKLLGYIVISNTPQKTEVVFHDFVIATITPYFLVSFGLALGYMVNFFLM